MIELPDPGEGRSWHVTPEGVLELWQGEWNMNEPITWSEVINQKDFLLSQQFIDTTNVAQVRLRARKMVANADAAGTYTYEQGKQVKK